MHEPTRSRWAPWRRRCTCGLRWPHPFEPPSPLPDGTDATEAVLRMGRPDWSAQQTAAYPLVSRRLLTPGQAARATNTRPDDEGQPPRTLNRGRWPA